MSDLITPDMQPDLRPVSNDPVRYRLAVGPRDAGVWELRFGGEDFRIPAGTETDGMSVPRVCWSAGGLLPDGVQRAAALVHDWIYRHGGDPPDGSSLRTYTRDRADELLYEMCIASGISEHVAILIHASVRTFGWMFWGDSRRAKVLQCLPEHQPLHHLNTAACSGLATVMRTHFPDAR